MTYWIPKTAKDQGSRGGTIHHTMQADKLLRASDRVLPTVRRLVRRGSARRLSRVLGQVRPEDVSLLLEALTPAEQLKVVDIALADYADTVGEVFVELEPSARSELLGRISAEQGARIVEAMPVDDQVSVLETIPDEMREAIVGRMKATDRAEVREQFAYADDSAGRLMTTEVFSLPQSTTVAGAIAEIQRVSDDVEMIFYLYVLDEEGYLAGVASLRQLLLSQPSKTLEEIMTSSLIEVTADTDQEEVAQLAARYDLLAIPVVDLERRLLGMITVDDVLSVVQQEVEEDVFKMMGTSDDELLYQGKPVRVARIRLPWLLVNMVGLLAGGFLIHGSQEYLVEKVGISLAEAAILVAFVPVIMGMGGNVGSQTATIAVRGIATGRLVQGSGRFRSFLWQQVKIGAVIALVCAALVTSVALYRESQPIYGLIIGVSLFLAIMIASLNGAAVPLLFERLGIDPAVASAPMVTTSCDVMGIGLYYGLAAALLRAAFGG